MSRHSTRFATLKSRRLVVGSPTLALDHRAHTGHRATSGTHPSAPLHDRYQAPSVPHPLEALQRALRPECHDAATCFATSTRLGSALSQLGSGTDPPLHLPPRAKPPLALARRV